jgi:hypothetical protein
MYLPMPVVLVLVNGTGKMLKKEKKTLSFTLLTETFQKELTETKYICICCFSGNRNCTDYRRNLSFNPLTDSLINENGESVKLDSPSGYELPLKGFEVEDSGFISPAEDGSSVIVNVKPDSERLQLLEPFPAWDGKNISGVRLLIKAKGKCTTDHISMLVRGSDTEDILTIFQTIV